MTNKQFKQLAGILGEPANQNLLFNLDGIFYQVKDNSLYWYNERSKSWIEDEASIKGQYRYVDPDYFYALRSAILKPNNLKEVFA
jgi:hypothetical protein